MRINRSSPIPLYYQLKQHLLGMIKDKALTQGCRLPSEEELIEESGLSRFTVRQALQELEREGLITRIRGKGTFVTESKVPLSVAWQLLGFTEDMKRKGHRVESRVMENRLIPASLETAEALQIKPKAPVVFIKRVRLVDGQPCLVDMVNVRSDKCPGMEEIDMTDRSLFDVLESEYQLRMVHAKRSLSIKLAAAWIAEALEIKQGTPLFLLKDLAFAENGEPIQCAETFINEGKSEFVFDLYRSKELDKSEKVTVEQTTHPNLRRKVE
jgi:GntR family transcriptional regulator